MINRRSFSLGLGASMAAFSAPAIAQSYPDKPIKLIVPYAAGGGTDAIARLIANAVGEKLGQTMVVENNGTAGGNVASQIAANAPPDGYTVLMANQGPMVVNPHLFKNLKVDPLKAFDPVVLITSAPLVLVVPAKSPITTAAQFIEHARKNPGKLSYGSAGNGSASHLAVVLLAQMAKLDMSHVPYRGAGPALNDLVAGQTDFMITTLPSVAGQIDGKTVRALAVTTAARTKRFPDVPTLSEIGVTGYESGAWYGFVVPKGTPAAVVDKLRTATVDAINTSIVRDRFANEGADPLGIAPDKFAEMMQRESARWAEVLKTANIEMN